jgi:hypothetical protein
MSMLRATCLIRILAVSAAAVCVATPSRAEPVLDRALSGLRVLNKKSCVIVKIDFNFRIQYGGHFPVDRGDELRVSVRAIDRAQAAALGLLKREALRAPDGTGAGIRAIDFEANLAGGAVLRVQFDGPTAYQVAPGSDFESVIIAIAGKAPSSTCKPEFPARSGDAWNTTVSRAAPVEVEVIPARPKNRASGKATPAQLQQAAAWMDEARAAVKKANYAEAGRTLAKVLALPENEHSAEAQEMLGVARQKAGQLAEARGEYEDYLVRYPSGEGADRVRQRLAGILTAQGQAPGPLRGGKDEQAGAPGAERAAPSGTTWSVSGSASQFYIRDDSFRKLRDPSLPPEINPDKDDHRVHQNVLLSSVDLIAAWHNSAVKSKFRFSGTEEHGFNSGDKDIVAVAALNLETTIREWDLTTRVGRQTRNTGGVLGRFDGGLVSWQANPFVRLNAVGGSPVERRKDMPFKDDKYFYGASVDFGPFWGGLETSLFAIEQRDRALVDRQAVGAELRYVQPDKSFFATVDYDTHFSAFNAAIASGSWTFADKSTLTGAVDYRKSPYLSAWTALQGQPFLTLYDMLKVKTKEEIDQLAIDRTATYKAATVGYSRPLTDKLQWSSDVTVANVSGTISSGGVEATLPPGTDYYASTQLIASSLFADGDMYIAGLRFANRPDSNLYVVDLSARYPLTADLRINPRLRVGYRVGDTTDLKEWSVLPSLLLNYYWTKDLSLELEVGTQWTRRDQLGVRETTTDLFLTAGIRYDFYADGKTKCAWPLSVCQSRGE